MITRALRFVASSLTCVALAASLYFCCPRAHADEVDLLVQSQMKSAGVPGVAVAVMKDGKIIKSEAYGLADTQSGLRVRTDTPFQIQSITKQFTATGIMMLVAEEKIQLDAPIGQYLPGVPAVWEKITVRHLLTQTSGLKDFINDPSPAASLAKTDADVLRQTAERPLNFQPGQAWGYSNTNYHLLAMIIQKVTGKWYGDFLDERIFKPLGMRQTVVMKPGENAPGQASGYRLINGKLQPGTVVGAPILGYGGGGIRSTVLDLAKWDEALYGEKLLKQSSLAQMWTPTKLNNGASHNYGSGWEIDTIAGHRLIGHAGNFSSGFSGKIDRWVDDRLTVIVLTNLMGAPTGRIAREIAGTYLPPVAPPVYKPIPDTEPLVTQRFVDVLRRAGEGKLRADDFTTATWTYIEPLAGQMQKDFTAIGPIETLTLVQRNDEAANRSYRYQAQFKRTKFILHFLIDKDDKIITMSPEDVNQ